MKRAIYILVGLVLTAAWVSCSKEDETPIDILISHNFNELPDTIWLEAPEDYAIRFAFLDEGGLDAYRLELLNDSVVSGDINRTDVVAWAGEIDHNLIFDDTLSFDAEARGRWNLELEAVDDAGNLSAVGPFLFIVSNPEIPEVTATDWSCVFSSDNLSLNGADTLQVKFDANDQDGLTIVELRLLEGGVETLVSSLDLTGEMVSDSLQIDIPESLVETGVLELIVRDALGNTSRQRYQISP